ncbi:MAG: tetratricopeptide repeat protein [Pirellulales bacterium]
MLSASAMSYREMALCNMAFCYAQAGDGQRAKDVYRQAIDLFPSSELARAGLRMLESVGKPSSASSNPE